MGSYEGANYCSLKPCVFILAKGVKQMCLFKCPVSSSYESTALMMRKCKSDGLILDGGGS